MQVRGPNGLVIDVDEALARSLVGDGNRGYEFVVAEPAAEPEKKPAPRRRRTSSK